MEQLPSTDCGRPPGSTDTQRATMLALPAASSIVKLAAVDARPFRRKSTDELAIVIVMFGESAGCCLSVVAPAAIFQPPVQVPVLLIVTVSIAFHGFAAREREVGHQFEGGIADALLNDEVTKQRTREGCENADHEHDDHQFDEREPALTTRPNRQASIGVAAIHGMDLGVSWDVDGPRRQRPCHLPAGNLVPSWSSVNGDSPAMTVPVLGVALTSKVGGGPAVAVIVNV